MRRFIIVILLCLTLIPFATGCERDKAIIVDPDPPPGPEGPPQPPPPPPPPPGLSSASSGSLTSVLELTVDMIAEKVLQGDYGHELQSLLAAEVAACLNQMSVENVVSISRGACVQVRSVESGDGSVMFNYGYIGKDVLTGAYGRDVMEALHAIVRGPKTEKL